DRDRAPHLALVATARARGRVAALADASQLPLHRPFIPGTWSRVARALARIRPGRRIWRPHRRRAGAARARGAQDKAGPAACLELQWLGDRRPALCLLPG